MLPILKLTDSGITYPKNENHIEFYRLSLYIIIEFGHGNMNIRDEPKINDFTWVKGSTPATAGPRSAIK